MVALTAANADIAEEVELGRTLLVQGHLDTAQRVLLKICQSNPECAEAFRVLAMVLSKRGDDRRARPLVDYAEELDVQRTRESSTPLEDVPSDAETLQNRLAMQATTQPTAAPKPAEPSVAARPPVVSEPALNVLTPRAPISAPPASAPVPVTPALGTPRSAPKSRAGWAIFTVFLCAALAAGAVAAYKQYGRATSPRPSPREELDRSLFSGTLEHLMRARDVARMELESGAPDADSLARLGLLNAFLVDDYAVEARKDAEDALRRAEAGPATNKGRAVLVASARALLAHAAGRLG